MWLRSLRPPLKQMKAFTELYHRLNQTNSLLEKQFALEVFFRDAPDGDAVWGLALLSGRTSVRLVGGRTLRAWVAECTDLPDWLVEESYQHVGDLAETLSLLLEPYRNASSESSATIQDLSTMMQDLLRLKKRDESERKEYILQHWRQLDGPSCFLFNKLITGGFRLGVGQSMTTRALSNCMNRPVSEVAQALMGSWDPTEYSLESLLNRGAIHAHTLPYPFYLASPLLPSPIVPIERPIEPHIERPIEPHIERPIVPHIERNIEDASQSTAIAALGNRTDWLAEWKWDGIRVQIIRRKGVSSVWSRGEERIDEAFPEIADLAQTLPPGTVIDGELLCGQFPEVRSFHDLQKRLGRTKPSARMVTQYPVFVYAFDLLEQEGEDIRQKALSERRMLLETLIETLNHPLLQASPLIQGTDWRDLNQKRQEARHQGSEGLMLKRAGSCYESGRKRGHWWKWKLDPMQLDAVLLYARPGHGRRSSLFTDYSMAIWDHSRTRLLPIAQVYSGLTDAEIREVDAWIKGHTTDRFGPVRTVTPELVFEIGFEGIQKSGRHKSGLALRFPRILRWRRDKLAPEADDLGMAEKLLLAPTKPTTLMD